MSLRERIDVKSNGTHLIIGRVEKVICPEEAIPADGFVNLEQAETVTVSGLDSYHKTDLIGRLPYVKPV